MFLSTNVFDAVKELIEKGGTYGSLLAFALLAFFLFLTRTKALSLDPKTYVLIFLLIIGFGAFCMVLFFIGELFKGGSINHPTTFINSSDTVVPPKTGNRYSIGDSVKVNNEGKVFLTLRKTDTVYQSNLDSEYREDVSLQENQQYGDLRTPLEITILSIDIDTQTINLSLTNLADVSYNKGFVFKSNGRGFYYTYKSVQYYLNFTDIRDEAGVKFVDLHIIKI